MSNVPNMSEGASLKARRRPYRSKSHMTSLEAIVCSLCIYLCKCVRLMSRSIATAANASTSLQFKLVDQTYPGVIDGVLEGKRPNQSGDIILLQSAEACCRNQCLHHTERCLEDALHYKIHPPGRPHSERKHWFKGSIDS